MKSTYIYLILTIIIIFIIGFRYISQTSSNNNSEKFITNLIQDNTSIKIIEKGDNPTNNYDIIVNNKDFYDKVLATGELGFGESYMDGDWDSADLEETIYRLILKEPELRQSIINNSISAILLKINIMFKSLLPNNTLSSSKENISSHYDIGNDLYIKMLDKNMQYTCAYFNKPNMTLDEAQEAKLDLIAKKLNFKKDMKVLDIGCGFGTAAVYFAKKYDVNVLGVSLSKEQINYYENNIKHKNVELKYLDYRNVTGKFDRVYSVGMFEHVGRDNYKEYFDKCYDLLKDDGIMLLHTIGTIDRNNGISDWIYRYIFPEGELPHISNLTDTYIDKWYLQDYQNFGLSYAKTLRAWRKNIGNWEGLDKYDERFRRMWDYYLLACAASFKCRHINLNQLVYFKNTTTRPDDTYYIRNCDKIY